MLIFNGLLLFFNMAIWYTRRDAYIQTGTMLLAEHAMTRGRYWENPGDTTFHMALPSADEPLAISVVGAGRSHWRAGNQWSRRHARVCAVEVCLDGAGVLAVNGREFTIQRGDAFVLHFDEDHAYRTGATGHWHKLFVVFDEAGVREIFNRLGLSTVHVMHLPRSCFRQAAGVIETIINALRAKPRNFRHTASLKAYQLLLLLAREARRARQAAALPTQLVAAFRAAEEQRAEPTRVATMAAAAGCSVTHLTRLFKQHLGVRAHDWLMARRMQRARLLLETSDLPLKAIADMTGFSSQYRFSAAFRARVGMPPGKYRTGMQAR